jgi:hypothetical protein
MAGVEQMILILVVTAAILIVAYFLQKKPQGHETEAHRSLNESLMEIVGRQSVPFALLGLFAFLAFWTPTMKDVWVPTIAANVAMVALAYWLIRLGLTEDRGRPFAVGVAYLLLWSVLRYVDLFGAYGGMLGASLMFFLCGGALFAVGLYWRKRKAVSLV